MVIGDHVDALRRRIGRHPDKAILGCTHYEIVADLFAAALPPGTPLIHQPTAVADALERYFERHPGIRPGRQRPPHLPDHRQDRAAVGHGQPVLGRAAEFRRGLT